jgi:hypothetical protein
MPSEQTLEKKHKARLASLKGTLCDWRDCLAVHDGAEEGWLTALVNQMHIITLCPKHAAELKGLVDFYKEDDELS